MGLPGVLGQSANAEATLRQAAQRVDQIADPHTQANLMAASEIFAELKLEQDIFEAFFYVFTPLDCNQQRYGLQLTKDR
jgi:DICT domain-containing protein